MYKNKLKNIKRNSLIEKLQMTFIKLLVFIFIIALIILGYNFYKYRENIEERKQTLADAKVTQSQVQKEVNKWKMQEGEFKDACKKANKMIVLEGDREVTDVYTKVSGEISDKGHWFPIKFLIHKFNDLKTKEITLNTTFHYEFVFDWTKIKPKNYVNRIVIPISKDYLILNPLSVVEGSTTIYDETHLLSGRFSPQQVTALEERTNIHTFGQIFKDDRLHTKALDNAIFSIQEVCTKLGIENVEFEISDDQYIAGDEVEVVN